LDEAVETILAVANGGARGAPRGTLIEMAKSTRDLPQRISCLIRKGLTAPPPQTGMVAADRRRHCEIMKEL
jgi:hypothetical protein